MPLASPSLGVQTIGNVVFDPADLSKVALLDDSGSAASESGLTPMSLVGPPGGPYTTLHTDTPPSLEEIKAKTTEPTVVVGASRELSHVVLQSLDHNLCPGAEAQDAESAVLCEWAGGLESVGGDERPQLTLVNAASEGCCSVAAGRSSARVLHRAGSTHGAVSGDGSKLLFTAPDPK